MFTPKTFDNATFDAASLDEFAADAAPRLARSVADCVQSNNLAKGFECWARECENLIMNSAVTDDWNDAIAFIDTRLPDFEPMPYAPFEVSRWVRMLKGVSSTSARGSCEFSVQELKSIPVSMLPALFDLFHARTEAGAARPEALVFAFVMCLPKTDGTCTALQICPITILRRLYRCWARYRSTEIVEWLSSKLPPAIAGGVQGMSVTDITAMVAHYLESSFDLGLPRLGLLLTLLSVSTPYRASRYSG